MGLGHLVRSAALAEMLASEYTCHFLYRHCPQALQSAWEHIYTTIQRVDDSITLTEEASILAQYTIQLGGQNAIVVLDGYHFDTDYQQKILTAGLRLVCIDDIHSNKFLADLIINHAPGAKIGDYVTSTNSQFALGLRFALLRKPFRLLSAIIKDRSSLRGIFICLGGADPNNGTLAVLEELTKQQVTVPINLVVGSAYQYRKELHSFISGSDLNVTVREGVSAEEMAAMMRTSSCGITSPSTVALEYLSSGGKLFLLQIADNQNDIRAALIERGLAYDFADFDCKGTFFVTTTPTYSPMDGQQATRFRKLFNALGITMRKANEGDMTLYYQWANDPTVRGQSFNSAEIVLAEHQRWFTQKLTDDNTELLVFERDGKAVGQVRLQVSDRVATIGYSVDEAARGSGIGLAMLHYAANYLTVYRPEVSTLIGYVKRDNVASLVTFRRLGYREALTDDYPNAVKFELNEF